MLIVDYRQPKHTLSKKDIRGIVTYITFGISAEKGNTMAVQIAIIGCGGMANGHLNAYLTIHQTVPGKVELVAMCDEVEERADQFAERSKR